MDIIDVNGIKENDRVKFITPNKTLFDGKIKKISDNYLGITIDIRQNEFIRLNKDQSIQLILVCEHQAVKCSSVVLGCNQSDFEQAIIISIPKRIVAIERREFERLPIAIDMEYSLLPLERNYLKLNDIEQEYFKYLKQTYTVDISVGSICFIVPRDEIDSKFALVSLSLKNEKIIALCEKIRTEYLDNSKYKRAIYKYTDIKVNHRQLIWDFVSENSKEAKEAKEA